MKKIAFIIILTAASLLRAGEIATNPPAPLNWTANQDHQNMMEQLGI